MNLLGYNHGYKISYSHGYNGVSIIDYYRLIVAALLIIIIVIYSTCFISLFYGNMNCKQVINI